MYKIVVNTNRDALGTERVLIYQFEKETSGTVVAESVERGFTPTMRDGIPMVVFGYEQATDYEQQFVIRYDDINTVQLTPDQYKLWQQFQIQASLNFTLYVDGKIWEILAVQQCIKPLNWQEQEITFLNQIVRDLLLCLQPLQFQALLKERSEQEQLVARITQKIGQSPNFDNLFRFATVEIRRLLKCDRVGIYHFHEDWSGEFIAESVGQGWISVVDTQELYGIQADAPPNMLSIDEMSIQPVPKSFHNIGLPTWVSRIAILEHKGEPITILILNTGDSFVEPLQNLVEVM